MSAFPHEDALYFPRSKSKALANHLLDSRMIAAMRLVLAAAALMIIYIDPAEPNRLVAVTYLTLVLYTIYSAALYFFVLPDSPAFNWLNTWSPWIDIVWYSVLVSLSRGTHSLFFFGFFFAVLVASFQWGFKRGFLAAIVSAVMFTVLGLLARPFGPNFELNRFLLRPVCMIALGYMMAYWGEWDIRLKRRLALLKETTDLSNPRFGIDRTVGSMIERLRVFYDADACLLVLSDQRASQYSIRRAVRRNPEEAMRAQSIEPGLADLLLALPRRMAYFYRGEPRAWDLDGNCAYDVAQGVRTTFMPEALETIRATFDGGAFITIPFNYRSELSGRLFLASHKRGGFDHSDIEFLLQAVEHAMPVIDNIRLVDRLASDAAEEERQRIARNIHDSVIQPYIGLKLGLVALRQNLESGGNDLAGKVDRLIEMTGVGITDLRCYVHGLKERVEREGSLVPAIRRFTAKFSETTGIVITVMSVGNLVVNDRLAAELFHMVVESLSNIRRHTHSTHVKIALSCQAGQLELEVENNNPENKRFIAFRPRSLAERTSALGGRLDVVRAPDDGARVSISIPL